MNFWCRVFPPAIFGPAAEVFDRMVMDTFRLRNKLPALTDVAQTQIVLPVRVGGFGLSSLVIVSPAAWYSALAQAFSSIRLFLGNLDELSPDIPFVNSLSQCLTFFKQFRFPAKTPISSSLANFFLDYQYKRAPAGSQRLIMAAINKSRSKALINEFPRNSADRARLTSLTAKYSGSWLTTPPTDPLFTLHDVHFSLGIRLRLGIAPYDDIRRCICGASLAECPLHFQSCRQLRYPVIIRHDQMAQVIIRIARLCGVVAQAEPIIDDNDNARSDGNLFFHAQSGHFDVAIIDPCAPTFVKSGQRPLGAASSRERLKINSYANRVHDSGSLFYPVVYECFGAPGPRVKDLILKIDEEAALNGISNMHGLKVKTFLYRALNFSLQKGNALIAIDGSRKSRARL